MKYHNLYLMLEAGQVVLDQQDLYNGSTFNLGGAICYLHGQQTGWGFVPTLCGFVYFGKKTTPPQEVIGWFGESVYSKLNGQPLAVVKEILLRQQDIEALQAQALDASWGW
mgnify:FL=1